MGGWASRRILGCSRSPSITSPAISLQERAAAAEVEVAAVVAVEMAGRGMGGAMGAGLMLVGGALICTSGGGPRCF